MLVRVVYGLVIRIRVWVGYKSSDAGSWLVSASLGVEVLKSEAPVELVRLATFVSSATVYHARELHSSLNPEILRFSTSTIYLTRLQPKGPRWMKTAMVGDDDDVRRV